MDVFIRNKPYTGTVKAAVLDWAGTAVDYGCIGPVSVFLEVFKKNGVEATLAEAREPMGVAKKDHVRAMCQMESVASRWEAVHGRKPDERDVDRMYPDTETMMVECIANHSTPIPGAVEAIEEFRKMGLKIGTCTGYTRPMVDVLAPAAAEKGYIPDAVICSSDAPAGRPYPYMCYLNAIQLQTYPMEAMVKIGDTIADIQEGLNAGMWTIAVTQTSNDLGLTRDEVENLPAEELAGRLAIIENRFKKAGAHYVVRGIWDCPDVIKRINERLSRGENPLNSLSAAKL